MRRATRAKSRAYAAHTPPNAAHLDGRISGRITARRRAACGFATSLLVYIFTFLHRFCTVSDGTKLIGQVPILYRVFEYKWRRRRSPSAMASHNGRYVQLAPTKAMAKADHWLFPGDQNAGFWYTRSGYNGLIESLITKKGAVFDRAAHSR